MKLPKLKQIILVLIGAALAVGICCLTVLSVSEDEISELSAAPLTQSIAEKEMEKVEMEPIQKEPEEVEVVHEEITEVPTKPKAEVIQHNAMTMMPEAIVVEESEPAEEIPSLDRTKPLYNVYAHGIQIDVPAELQWLVHDICEEYSFYEKYVYGMIITESTFNPKASNGIYKGLCQIGNYWKSAPTIPHFTEHPENRDLTDPYDNMLTLAELWCYARDTYGLDLMTEDGMMRVCYWHNTGKDPRYITSSSYFNICAAFADELEPLQ